MKKIDTSGMSCPQPVLMTKNAISDKPEALEVLVDNTVARDNVERFLNSSGYKVEISDADEGFILEAKK